MPPRWLPPYPFDYEGLLAANNGIAMTSKIEELLEAAKAVKMTPEEKEEQRRSFAYGNTKIENPRITREIIDTQAEALRTVKK